MSLGSSWVLIPEANQLWLRGMGWGPLRALLSAQAIWSGLLTQEEGHLAGVGPVLGQGRLWNVVRAYSLLEHEDAGDEDEGDEVGGDPHETVLIRGLWRDGPRPASSHGWSTPGSRLRVHGQKGPGHHWGGAGKDLEEWALWAWCVYVCVQCKRDVCSV